MWFGDDNIMLNSGPGGVISGVDDLVCSSLVMSREISVEFWTVELVEWDGRDGVYVVDDACALFSDGEGGGFECAEDELDGCGLGGADVFGDGVVGRGCAVSTHLFVWEFFRAFLIITLLSSKWFKGSKVRLIAPLRAHLHPVTDQRIFPSPQINIEHLTLARPADADAAQAPSRSSSESTPANGA